MSTKTLRKRIALVAVSALTAGLVSVVVAPAANAGQSVAADFSITSTTTDALGANLGICTVSADASATVTTASALVFTQATAGTGYLKVTDGPGYWASVTGTGNTLNGSGSTATFAATSSGTAKLKATAVGKIYITAYSALDAAVESYIVTVVASCAGDTFSPAYSFFRAVTASGEAATTNVDQTGATDVENTSAYIKYALWDAYSAALTTSGALVVTATGNARIGINGVGTTSTAVLATTGGAGYIQVKASADGVATDTVVTATFNGVTVGSKSIKIRGVAKKLVVTDPTIGLSGVAYSGTSTAGVGSFTYQWQDSAGNALINATQPGIAGSALTGLNTLVTAAGNGASSDLNYAPSALSGDDSYGSGTFSCQGSTKSGSATIAVAGYNANLETIVSNTFTAQCGGEIDTWAIALDKATYSTGEIATLTITAKDANGAMPASSSTLSGVAASTLGVATSVFIATPADTATTTLGVKTYKFYVTNTPGSYTAVVDINAVTEYSAKYAAYKVVDTSGGVTNADVLKAIVSLIASINKQIAALQKALLKK